MTTHHPMSRDFAARARRTRLPRGIALGLVGLLGVMPACEDDTDGLQNTITRRGNAGSGTGPATGAGGDNGSTPAAGGNIEPSGSPGPAGGGTAGQGGGVADAGEADTGTDAGALPDAGVLPADAGVVPDAGVSTDAGFLADGGLASDAGVALLDTLADGQILYVVDTLNAGEVEQAQAALPRLSNDAVRSFAQVMVQEHQAARANLLTFAKQQQIGLQGSTVADQLRLSSLQLERAIDAAPVGEVDRVYIDSQVTAHSQADDLLANLIGAADSPAVQAELTQLRLNVLGHLQAAEGLQSSLNE